MTKTINAAIRESWERMKLETSAETFDSALDELSRMIRRLQEENADLRRQIEGACR